MEKNSNCVANLIDLLFNKTYLDDLNLMKIVEDKDFLSTQRQKGRPRYMICCRYFDLCKQYFMYYNKILKTVIKLSTHMKNISN